MKDLVKPCLRKKLDEIVIHVGTNDLTSNINIVKLMKKVVNLLKETDLDELLQPCYDSRNFLSELKSYAFESNR